MLAEIDIAISFDHFSAARLRTLTSISTGVEGSRIDVARLYDLNECRDYSRFESMILSNKNRLFDRMFGKASRW